MKAERDALQIREDGMPLPLFNIEIRITAEGGPLARSAALGHPLIKNLKVGEKREKRQ
jgi:hypothetical protein